MPTYPSGRAHDEDSLSRKPQNIRNRLRRAARNAKASGDRSVLDRELEIYREETGFKPVAEWDLEELAFGKPRNRVGGFGGRTPSWVSADVQREAKKRLHTHALGKLGGHIEIAIRTVLNLMISEETDEKGKPIVDARTKLAAAQFVIEHIIGKPTTVLEMDATDTVRQMFAAAIVLDDGRVDSHLAIEGEVVEDTEAGE